jgi:heterogeneous nuclear ribonucleoprotein L
MSSSSSSPRETYEEDREYESQAKRLKTEEGEIEYSAEEGENRREATPRGGSDSGGGGGGGRSFSQPVTKRGAASAVPGGSRASGARRRGFDRGEVGVGGRTWDVAPICFSHPDREPDSSPGSGLTASLSAAGP